MKNRPSLLQKRPGKTVLIAIVLCLLAVPAACGDLAQVQKAGVLRHLGVPYANFITGAGDGLDVELIRLFAQHIGVQYTYVQTSWKDVIGDLTGKIVKVSGDEVDVLGETPVKGDLIANGFTILAWRQKVVDYSEPTFPTQIWLVAAADIPATPIVPRGNIREDITAVKALLPNRSVLGVANTCLEPSLYHLAEAGAVIRMFAGNLNELAPAVLAGEADTTLLDVPDALIALEKWPGQMKVLGPLSPMQNMGVAFPKTSPGLRQAFNRFLRKLVASGTYRRLVSRYYPAVFQYYPDFFE